MSLTVINKYVKYIKAKINKLSQNSLQSRFKIKLSDVVRDINKFP